MIVKIRCFLMHFFFIGFKKNNFLRIVYKLMTKKVSEFKIWFYTTTVGENLSLLTLHSVPQVGQPGKKRVKWETQRVYGCVY